MPRETLTREQIVQAAMQLLDTEGLEGLNMRLLGKRLESAATAVYWHVGSRANLVALAADQAWHGLALPDLATMHWRAAATLVATELYAMLTRHTWVVETFGSVLPSAPGKFRHDDYNLALYETAGFSEAQATMAASAVFTFVLGNALGAAAVASLTRKLGSNGRNAGKLMRENLAKARASAKQFPRLRARMDTAAAGYGAVPHNSFEFGLKAMLDGLEAQLGAPRTTVRQTKKTRSSKQ